ncbi:hypothetical protein E2C01_076521 [Portunus trituberculatus]|uniref:Uncharacterized protein n=1 Tax=Portunus trituberculatus TaxID=210409 RepID=A0A5B7IHV6_PORTR|nr:hypothetical protein [Portunus trituberculatus]
MEAQGQEADHQKSSPRPPPSHLVPGGLHAWVQVQFCYASTPGLEYIIEWAKSIISFHNGLMDLRM